jgi:hypothetical protein
LWFKHFLLLTIVLFVHPFFLSYQRKSKKGVTHEELTN